MSLYLPPPPRIKRELAVRLATEKWREDHGDEPMPDVYFFMVRGYRATTMGPTPENDVGIWDDLIALVTPHTFHAINANLDPSRTGWNPGVGKPFGILQPGWWWWYPGPHKGRMPAFRQADDADVGRKFGFPHDGKFFVERCWGRGDKRNYHEWGHQQVNIHLGGYGTTSSWLCLTVPPQGGKEFLQRGVDSLKAYKQKFMPGLIVEGPIN
jgi:hypothetical protein